MKANTWILFLFLNSCLAQEQKINGISFVASNTILTAENIRPVLEINANWVTLMPFAFMKSERDTTVVFNHKRQWINEKKEGLLHSIKLFKKEHISIMLKPQVWIPKSGFTGNIAMKTENEWQAFEKNYQNFILFYAQIAQEEQCNLFCIGTEMNSFVSKRPFFWQNLISKVRTIYKGKITYAENWDKYQNVPFLKDLDYIGIDAYFPLDYVKTASIESLELAWKPIKKNIELLAKKHKKKILFTEYGYQSRDFTTKDPWNYSANKGVNLEAQSNAMQALYNQFWKENWFGGGFLWKWFDNHQTAGGLNDYDYTVQNKPAAAIVKRIYAKNK